MAHVQFLGKDKWKAVIENKEGSERKRITRTFYAKTKEEAKSKLVDLKYEHKHNKLNKSGDQALKEYLLNFIHRDKSDLAPRTYESYRRIINNHIIPYFGDLKLKQISDDKIEDYKIEKLNGGRLDGQGGLSKRTVQYHLTILNKALSKAHSKKIIDSNPCKQVKFPSPDFSTPKPLNKKQIHKLVKAAKELPNKWLYNVITVCLFSGLRRGELMALKWDQVDLEQGTIHINLALKRTKDQGLIFDIPKSRNGIRTISIDSKVVQLLTNLKKEQEKSKAQLKDKYNNQHNLVFCKNDGSIAPPKLATDRFRRLVDNIGLHGYTLHNLRHTHATIMIEKGAPLSAVQKRMGHESIETTIKYYAAVTTNMEQESVSRFSEAVDLPDL